MQLSKRDRLTLTIGGVVVFLFLLVQFIFVPFLDKRSRMTKGVADRQEAIVAMRLMEAEFKELNQQSNTLIKKLASRTAGFSLFSFLEQKASLAKVKQSIEYMKPSESIGEGLLKQVMVEMKLRGISLSQMVEFLDQVESQDNIVALKRISIQENTKQAGTLDVILQVISIDQAETNKG